MEPFSDKDVSDVAALLAGSFYQTWDLDEKGDMESIIDDLYKDPIARDKIVNGIHKILIAIESISSVKEILHKIGYNYDPAYDDMTNIEWLVLVKQYMQNKTNIFQKDHN